ncbi:protease modulator HflC [Ketobacter alkanivorans]|jgi:modulator of FtsH protease HflC|uniref:Protein HflC n=1 Tax=Ketobacter alkanivorans TaxID=1917421 RepID=A0A2K9LFE5_9GAMM|nr:protease modulator HflC [Ketobacter alkanivorans]MAR91862.1 HflC protein [Pseudomonadales bacterium]HAG95967.1 protease modulator HflC [Gammaproteobacteria bacterium]AUM11079.1 HflC protein [Ketobacter alkanivorans]MAR93396.1 HflC protein [Pseudomonadales bacterium]HAU16406.1 protease modulator HflC [Gammaproteobacteria bacterium]|tara:strand:+ start:1214 stop:2170 length:957 start_codon:yes stop_codon:yes gene_type:complete
MNRGIYIALAILFPSLIVVYEAFYTVNETEQVIITQFGKPVGNIVEEAGLKLKIPFIQEVNRIEKRILLWDGSANDMPTKDKLYITVDTFGRWRIKDPLQYFLRLRDERSAQSRLEDILGSETRNAVAKHELIEIVRSTKGRSPAIDPLLKKADVGKLLPITRGRRQIEEDILAAASVKLSEFGIELLDIRFKRINYNESVRQKIYARMISERQQIAERFRSEGAGEAAKIIGNKERDLQRIESEAYREIQSIQGVADAKATDIYSAAYNRSQAARELYDLVKTLETYKKVIDPSTTLVLTTESELYRLMNGVNQPRK